MADNDVPNLRKVPAAFRLKSVPTLPTGDDKLDAVQENTRKAIDDMNATCPILQGRHVTASVGGLGTVTIDHGLGRQIRGWIVDDITGGPNQLSRSAVGDETKTLTLYNAFASTVVFALWVY